MIDEAIWATVAQYDTTDFEHCGTPVLKHRPDKLATLGLPAGIDSVWLVESPWKDCQAMLKVRSLSVCSVIVDVNVITIFNPRETISDYVASFHNGHNRRVFNLFLCDTRVCVSCYNYLFL